MAPTKRARARRARGSGSIYPNKDGTYTAQLTVDGRLVRKRAPDRAAAEARLAGLQELKRRQIDMHQGTQTLADWLNAWYAQKVRSGIKPRTADLYTLLIELYILPHLGQMRLIDLRAGHIQDALNAMQDSIHAGSEGRWSGSRTVQQAASLLRAALALAVARKVVPDNPYAGIILPRYRPDRIEPLDDAQCAALLDAAHDHRLGLLWHVALTLGLRRGELLALRWSAVDDRAGTIRIEHQIQVLSKRPTLCPPKTPDSVRMLPLPRGILLGLRAHWEAQQIERRLRGLNWQEHGLIFPSTVGTSLWPDSLEQLFRRTRDRAGIPATVKLHHLRHTCSTMLDEAGASEALKAGILGHAKSTDTQRYTHARLAAMRAVLQAVEDRLTHRATHTLTETGNGS